MPCAPWCAGMRRMLPALALAAVLLGVAATLAGYSVWRTAQMGIARMEGDVANAVRLESLREHSSKRSRPACTRSVPESVQRSSSWTMRPWRPSWLPSTHGQAKLCAAGAALLRADGQGWQRSVPIAGFWGPTETLDTAHLHFVFGRRDQAVVAAAAPGAEAMYVLLHRATGVDLAPGRPGADRDRAGVISVYRAVGRRPPPADLAVALQGSCEERVALLGRQLRLVLVKQLMATAAQRNPAKAQWQPLVQALGSWLEFSTAIGFAPNDEAAALQRLALRPLHSAWHLADLQEDDAALRSRSPGHGRLYPGRRGRAAKTAGGGGRAVDRLHCRHYGIDVLPRLLQGFAQYEDWEELAPAVLGVSAAELEEAWHGGG